VLLLIATLTVVLTASREVHAVYALYQQQAERATAKLVLIGTIFMIIAAATPPGLTLLRTLAVGFGWVKVSPAPGEPVNGASFGEQRNVNAREENTERVFRAVRGAIITGQRIGLTPRGWCHVACIVQANATTPEGERVMSRPCRYCSAAYPEIAGEICDDGYHRDTQPLYDLAAAMAAVFQHRPPTDEQVGWFVDDAEAVIGDLDPLPAKWRIRRLPENNYEEFDCRFRVNDVTYVVQAGGKDCKALPVRLSTYRQWQREADAAASA
jgi:hypothetical protein